MAEITTWSCPRARLFQNVPDELAEKISEMLKPYEVGGYNYENKDGPWSAPGPAYSLWALRKKRNLNQATLAALLGMQQSHISEIERGKRTVGWRLAHRIAKLFGTDYRVYL